MAKYIMIKADFNDADYSHSINKITDSELKAIGPALKVLKNCKGSVEDFEVIMGDAEEHDEDKFESLNLFNSYFPYAGDNEIHTIVDVQIFEGTIRKLF